MRAGASTGAGGGSLGVVDAPVEVGTGAGVGPGCSAPGARHFGRVTATCTGRLPVRGNGAFPSSRAMQARVGSWS